MLFSQVLLISIVAALVHYTQLIFQVLHTKLEAEKQTTKPNKQTKKNQTNKATTTKPKKPETTKNILISKPKTLKH